MATAKYLARVSGVNTEVIPTVTGAPDEIAALGPDARWHINLMPVGIGPEVRTVPAFEDLTAGNFVNIFLSGGVAKARKADATTSGKPAHGFVLSNVTAPADATVFGLSNTNTALAGLTIGSVYYLSTTPGGVMIAPGPVGSGVRSQELGIASLSTEMVFDGPASASVILAS
jgi:hypothetical protein